MSVVFCDSSAFYAFLTAADKNASDAARTWDSLITGTDELVTTNYVAVECVALLQARLGMPFVSNFRNLLDEFVKIHWIDHSLHLAALDQLVALNRRKVSFVDCSSFTFMRRHGIKRVFAYDAHFEEFGFVCT
jgi:predicted nucleic acid-binding protein